MMIEPYESDPKGPVAFAQYVPPAINSSSFIERINAPAVAKEKADASAPFPALYLVLQESTEFEVPLKLMKEPEPIHEVLTLLKKIPKDAPPDKVIVLVSSVNVERRVVSTSTIELPKASIDCRDDEISQERR